MEYNICGHADIYKNCHWKMYPQGMTRNYSYLTARKGGVVWFGPQYYLIKYLTGNVVTEEKISRAERLISNSVGRGVFNTDGWNSLLQKYQGKLPVQICSQPEGKFVGENVPLLTIENTDTEFAWLPSYLETLLVNLWFPSSVATIAYNIRQSLKEYWERSSDSQDWLNSSLSNSGMRSAACPEAGSLASAAHLLSFGVTTAPSGIELLEKYYFGRDIAYASSGAEHSVITSYGEENELESYERCLDSNPDWAITIPVDSYNIWKAVGDYFGGTLKSKIEQRVGKVFVRPDSGQVIHVLLRLLNLLAEKFGYTFNSKGYKVLNTVKVIQGDGIKLKTIGEICTCILKSGFAIDNLRFGMGGALVHSNVNRDTFAFAQKTSWVENNGVSYNVRKNPITDPQKKSIGGRFDDLNLPCIFYNGEIVNYTHWDDIKFR